MRWCKWADSVLNVTKLYHYSITLGLLASATDAEVQRDYVDVASYATVCSSDLTSLEGLPFSSSNLTLDYTEVSAGALCV